MIRSMTGFARTRRTIGDVEVTISVKSVNHRGLDLHFHIGPDLDPFEGAMRSAIKRHVNRGHVDVRVNLQHVAGNNGTDVDAVRLAHYMTAFRKYAGEYKLTGEPDLNSALRIPGMLLDTANLELGSEFEAPLVAALEEALRSMNQFRAREGAELVAVMKSHSASICQLALRIEEIRGTAVEAFHARLKERLNDLLAGVGLEPQRLAQEVAVLVDRSDIGEEIARLKIHAKQLDEILEGQGEIGKKLDFLLQEMNREANTILSKTSGIGETGLEITDLALAAKADIEKIREQALNLE